MWIFGYHTGFLLEVGDSYGTVNQSLYLLPSHLAAAVAVLFSLCHLCGNTFPTISHILSSTFQGCFVNSFRWRVYFVNIRKLSCYWFQKTSPPATNLPSSSFVCDFPIQIETLHVIFCPPCHLERALSPSFHFLTRVYQFVWYVHNLSIQLKSLSILQTNLIKSLSDACGGWSYDISFCCCQPWLSYTLEDNKACFGWFAG